MLVLLTTDPGLESIALRELSELRPDADARVTPGEMSGSIEARLDDDGDLATLTTVHHIVDLRGSVAGASLEGVEALLSDAEFPELADAASFRVTAERLGSHDFNSVDVQRRAGAALHRRYGTAVDLEGYELEVYVRISGEQIHAGIRRTRQSLDRRIRRAANLRSALKPTVAAAMIRMVGAHRGGGRLLDPMCGSATISVEAKRINPRLEVSASDWDPQTIEVARGTVANHGLEIEVREVDARALGAAHTKPFDYIVTDPPYGVRQAKHTGRTRLYGELLASFKGVLAPSGRIAAVALKRQAFLAAAERSGLRVEQARTVRLGTISPLIAVLSR